MVTVSVGEEEVMDLVNSVTGEVSVSKEEVDLYNKFDISDVTRKIELSRGVVSSDGTDEESGSDITSIIVAKKEKSAQGGKDKKSEKSKEKE
uniref:Uncharacterized protein n=1 Tax=Rhizophagus irregularis (strain DAOM 181602 / DAOM 197198 / MUCL 43194) TaxID=747089 RepID=U9UHN7_RHIID